MKIEIQVGVRPASKSFYVHKGVLCFYSGYFRGALRSDIWTEAREGILRLGVEEVSTFEKFVYWTYSRRFCNPTATDTKDIEWRDIVKLYIFGDRRNIPLLQNEAVNLLRKKIAQLWQLPAFEVDYIYSNTTSGSPLRKFVIEVIGKARNISFDKQTYVGWSSEPLIDLLALVWDPKKASWSKEDVAALDMCQYHVHEEGVTCRG